LLVADGGLAGTNEINMHLRPVWLLRKSFTERQAKARMIRNFGDENSRRSYQNDIHCSCVPAFAEELFRGVLQRLMIQITRRPLPVLLSQLLFSAIHGQFLGFFPAWF
jgi:hypothetical protein